MPTKWLQERPNGSKNDLGIRFEGPGMESAASRNTCECCLTLRCSRFAVKMAQDEASIGP